MATRAQTPAGQAAATAVPADAAVFSVGVPQAEVKSGDKDVVLEIRVANAKDVGAFSFVLGYDGHILKFTKAEDGGFLGSSGRQVICNDPSVDAGGAVRYTCVSTELTPPGPDGAGTLARLHFQATGGGSSPLRLTRLELVHPDATLAEQPATAAATANLAVQGGGGGLGVMWWVIGGVVALLVVVCGAIGWRLRTRRQQAGPAPLESGVPGSPP